MKKHIKFTVTGCSAAVILIAAAAVLLLSCGKNKDKTTMADKVSMSGGIAYSQHGVSFFKNNKMLYYVDKESGKKIYLCDKPNCTHDNKDCNAYVEGLTNTAPVIYNNRLYFIVQEDGFTQSVYEADPNGTNRKVIARLKEIFYAPRALYIDRYILHPYKNSYSFEMDSENMLKELDKHIAGLAVIDLLNHEVVYIPEKEDYDATIFEIHYYNNKIYYDYSYSDVKIDYSAVIFKEDNTADFSKLDQEYINQHRFYKLFSYDLETGQETCIYEGQNIDIQDFYEDKAFLTSIQEDTCKIYSLDLVNGEITLLHEDLEDTDTGISIDGDRLICYRYISDDDSEYYYHDLSAKTTVPIGKLNNLMAINAVMEDFLYVTYYDKNNSRELCTGYLNKEDFYANRFDKITPLFYPNRDMN